MATDLSLCRLREMLQLACGSCNAAFAATSSIINTPHFPDAEGIGKWWKENCDATGKALGYGYKAKAQFLNAAMLCEQDFPGDAEQMRNARDELAQRLTKIVKFYHPAHQHGPDLDWDGVQRDLWCSLHYRISAAHIAASSLLNSDAMRSARQLQVNAGVSVPPSDSTPKRCGRPKADYETTVREAKLAAAWVRARDAGTRKADFAKENGLTVDDVDLTLDRVAARKRTSE